MAAAAPPPPPPPPRGVARFDGHPYLPDLEAEWDRVYGRGRPVAILRVTHGVTVVLRYQGFRGGKVLR